MMRRFPVWAAAQSSRLTLAVMGVSLGAVCAMLLLIFLRILPVARTSPFLPLHYNIFLGIDRFGPWWMLFLLPLLGLAVFFLNNALATLFLGRSSVFESRANEPLLVSLFIWTTLVVELTFLIALLFSVLLNV